MATLVIDLRTDFNRTEFHIIDVHLVLQLSRRRAQDIYVEFIPSPSRGDLRAGIRLTEINDLTTGTYFLVIRLLDRRGASIGMATSTVDLTGNLSVPMLIRR